MVFLSSSLLTTLLPHSTAHTCLRLRSSLNTSPFLRPAVEPITPTMYFMALLSLRSFWPCSLRRFSTHHTTTCALRTFAPFGSFVVIGSRPPRQLVWR